MKLGARRMVAVALVEYYGLVDGIAAMPPPGFLGWSLRRQIDWMRAHQKRPHETL